MDTEPLSLASGEEIELAVPRPSYDSLEFDVLSEDVPEDVLHKVEIELNGVGFNHNRVWRGGEFDLYDPLTSNFTPLTKEKKP